MSEPLNILVTEWLAGDSGSPAERETNAELSISIGNYLATEVEDFESKTVRRTIRVSAGLVAMWLIANWWRLRWEAEPSIWTRENMNWAMSHHMPAIGGGFVWPDLAFRGSDGKQITVNCKRNSVAFSEELSPIRYLNGFSTNIDVSTFEKSVNAFVETVILRLNSCGVRKSELHDLWDDLRYEKGDAKVSSHRKLEALLGLDPDEDDPLINSLSKWSKTYGNAALEEISASTDKSQIETVLADAKAAARAVKSFAEMPGGNERSALMDLNGEAAPWQQGQKAAYALREKWDLGTKPISDDTLADRLNITTNKLIEVKELAPFSFALNHGSRLGLVLNRPHTFSRRFDTARLIGDHVGFDLNDLWRPATGAVTNRQKFQRAFAAEFLCPSEMIRDRFSGRLDQGRIGDIVAGLSAEYEVAERLILHHMENRNVLPYGMAQSSLMLA
ncbi:MAG: hypothetical protein ABR976_11835 [Terracidiphilus sp.]